MLFEANGDGDVVGPPADVPYRAVGASIRDEGRMARGADRRQDGPKGRASNSEAPNLDLAWGLLLALALLPAAALRASDGLGASAALGDVALMPAAMFLQGYAFAREARPVRRGLRLAALAAASAICAVATGAALHLSWREGLAAAVPALRLALLPAPYMAALAALRTAPAPLVLLLAIGVHVAGVIAGGSTAAALALFPYFALGAILARSDRLTALVAAEPEFAAASGPILAALTIALGARTTGPTSLAALGPAALLVGLLAGPATIAAAQVCARTAAAPTLARLGRTAPTLAVAWLPLFEFLLAVARRGGAPGAASLVLFSGASL
ncbi:MAG: hypothetical protein KGM18_15005, partial [Sphingomonadales bacterium]|nr:hypothetical protein [Sphingomonadales bacterium]